MYNYPSLTRFQQHVDLKDYRPPTRKEYVRNLRKLAEHFQSDPAGLTENQLREYFLFLRQHKGYKHSAMNAAKFALRSFYHECLGQTAWSVFSELRIAEPDVLPIVLSRVEIQSLLGALTELRFRTCLRLMYHCGLRVGETVSLRVRDIHGREVTPTRPAADPLTQSWQFLLRYLRYLLLNSSRSLRPRKKKLTEANEVNEGSKWSEQ